ncbi:MAG: serine/threonine protein kinase, partial [Myxococcaceae bacterium]|nr:serine/threonine protein kinase [Myxococcaceae bacterium]
MSVRTPPPQPCVACHQGKPIPPLHRVEHCADCGRTYLIEQPREPSARAATDEVPATTLVGTQKAPASDETFVDEEEEHTPPPRRAPALAPAPVRRSRPRAEPAPRAAARKELPPGLPELEVKPGATVGGYKLVARIGAGGMGTVWLARQLSLDRNVAVKILRPALANNPKFVIQFAHEALAAAQLVHHNIAQIYDTGTEGRLHFFSMEYVEGESLSALLRREGKLDSEVAAGYVLQAARGLEFAHDRAMIHRDIKPENLLINRDGIVKVADLGLVMRTDTEEVTIKRPPSPAPTHLGLDDPPHAQQVVGTPAFMAPEQANDSATIDGRADVYSLGCTLYNLVAGRLPFEGDSTVVLMSKHFFEEPVPPEQHNRRVPVELSAIILKAMAKKPEQRFQTMDQLIEALEGFLGVDGSSVFSPREEHAALLEQAVADFNGAAWVLRRRLVAGGLLLLLAAATTTAALLHAPRVAVAIAGFALTGWISALVVNASAQRASLLLKLRQLVLTAPLWTWLL